MEETVGFYVISPRKVSGTPLFQEKSIGKKLRTVNFFH
jgi:hypothetical protein